MQNLKSETTKLLADESAMRAVQYNPSDKLEVQIQQQKNIEVAKTWRI